MTPIPIRSRRGSVLILILAMLVLIAVMAFGFLDYTSGQRGVARRMHMDGLLRMALVSGRDHAVVRIEASASAAATVLTQPWSTEFAATSPWPSRISHPDPTARRDARLAALAGTWAQDNAADLWRWEPGLSTTAAAPIGWPQAHDDGFTIHDGTGRWWDVAWYDRQFARVDGPAKAAYRLRYAVGVVDQSGLLLANKARYRHLTPGGAIDPEGWYTGAATVPLDGQPCPVTDRPLGVDDPALGYDRIWYNAWRAIPCDHQALAYHLLTSGFGLDESRPKVLWDDLEPVGGSDNAAVGRFRENDQDRFAPFYIRRKVNLPDVFRQQGYRRVELNYPQFSLRFSDFLPFEMNPWAPDQDGGTMPDETDNRGRGWVRRLPWSGAWTDPAAYQAAGVDHAALDTLWTGATVAANIERIRNRHPANLAALVTAAAPSGGQISETARAIEYLMWAQVDVGSWQAIAQGLRIHQVLANVRRSPGAVDGLVQCFTPFGSPIGMLNSPAGVTGATTSIAAKNRWEMRTQWAVNANTAPPRVLEGLVRLVVPQTLAGVSLDSPDPQPYLDHVRALADRIVERRPFAPGMPNQTWWSGVSGALTRQGLASLDPSSPSAGRGPLTCFAVRAVIKGDPAAATDLLRHDAVIIDGRHLSRFGTAVPKVDKELEFRFWMARSAIGVADARDRIAAGARPFSVAWWSGEQRSASPTGVPLATAGNDVRYVSPSGGTWIEDPAGNATWIRVDLFRGADGFAEAVDFDPLVTADGVADQMVAFIDHATERWRPSPTVPWVWRNQGPGLALVAAPSRTYRIAVRARIEDLDRPDGSLERGWDLVYQVDADRSGAGAGTGFWDGV
ncbi:MAG: hypothetical protein RLZZ127_2782, partial [Planctomycetota bacterium]